MDAPRDDLIRNVEFDVRSVTETGDGLTLEGYAAVFDSPTEINSWEGNFVERIKPGAFTKTLSERTPVLMFNHGQHPVIGDMPIGIIQHAREDARGVFVRARLASNWLVEPVRDAIAQGAVDGMSFRFSVPEGKDTWRKGTRNSLPERDIHELRCMELGPVVFPAYPDTEVGVRSQEIASALADPDVRSDLARVLFTLVEARDENTRTLPEAADGTSDAESRDETTEEPPEDGHSQVRTPAARRQLVRRALLREKGILP